MTNTKKILIRRNNIQPGTTEPISFGIPIAQSQFKEHDPLILQDASANKLPLQTQITALWPDNSIKWLLIDTILPCEITDNSRLSLSQMTDDAKQDKATISVDEDEENLFIDTGRCIFTVSKLQLQPIKSLKTDESTYTPNAFVSLINSAGETLKPFITHVEVPCSPAEVKATIRINGEFVNEAKNERILFSSKLYFYIDSSLIQWDFSIHNPKAAEHKGGLWDLGDKGSFTFKELSCQFDTDKFNTATLKEHPQGDWTESSSSDFSLFQASSGGTKWNSKNHINSSNSNPISNKGYTLKINERSTNDLRAEPYVHLNSTELGFNCHIDKFWQNFPKSICLKNNKLKLSLFPNEFTDTYELQGGERKNHSILLNFEQEKNSLSWVGSPSQAIINFHDYSQSNTVPHLFEESKNSPFNNLIIKGIIGENSFFSKREAIDEYGWRNFGEIYADHETLYQTPGEEPLISHYNNQYDPIYGFARQYISTGDSKWFELMNDLARHVTDIDIYHTEDDRDEYNNGLFWHTDHYLEAHTCTHRTFTRYNDTTSTGQTGGGPGKEHCYTTGLMYHYLLTGNNTSKQAVLSLTDWMIKSHEGSPTIMGTLLSIKNNELKEFQHLLKGKKDYFKYPLTRGTGNYINCLLDAFSLSGNKTYLSKAEEVINNTLHPNEDINNRDLLNIESHWSYTILLQAIFKYLQTKESINELDTAYEYGRQCVTQFSLWMLENEEPYLTDPDKLEYPNDTWVAQDIRKASILKQASQYQQNKNSDLLKKANTLYNYVFGVLSQSPSLHFSRIQIILLQNLGPETIDEKMQVKRNDVNIIFTRRQLILILKTLFNLSRKIVRAIKHISIKKEVSWLKSRYNA